ncbi:RNA polymerase II transcriptional coactivator KELP [Cicer arietinum]|uniref:RNA polymerase II transcriptional coactivator KELP n=1 Tax=Cicer arietinum TaxID=3827 RepID=A0A1S2YEE2_CICAR|nr:RNA polymerase II transcriptional coactivator KELP [Cicer arietinum]
MEDAETKGRIEETVTKILQESNMDEVTESKVRKQASNELGINLSQPHFKSFVKQIIEAFIQQKQQQQEEEEEEKEKEKEKQHHKQEGGVSNDSKLYDDSGDLVICELGKKRKVTIQEFRGKTFVSIREFYTKDGKELPSSKGISLTEEQWSAFKKNVPAIEKAIQKMESHV